MRIIWHRAELPWVPTRYGTMTMEDIRRRLDELADEAARELAEERAGEPGGSPVITAPVPEVPASRKGRKQ